MRILIVSNLFPPDYTGGQEINAWKIAHALRARGHDVHVATSRYRPSFTPTEPEPEWVHRIFHFVEPVPDRRSGRSATLEIMRKLAARVKIGEPNAKALEGLLGQERFDLLYPFGMHQIGLATLEPAARRNMPTLWHCGDHYIADHFAQARISRTYRFMMERALKRWTDMERRVDYRHMAFVSRFLLDYFIEQDFRPEFPYIVPRGIDFALGEDVDRQRTSPATFLMACRIDATKGVHHAVEAARILASRAPELEWRIDIAGSGDPAYQAQLEALIAENDLQDRVKFIGKLTRPQTLERLRLATAFLSTSVWGEPFANTIIETLGSGTPLIGAVAGSILEVVVPGKTALTYEKNSPGELADHMERLLRDPSLGMQLARAGLDAIRERYTMDRIMDLTEETFDKVLRAYGKAVA